MVSRPETRNGRSITSGKRRALIIGVGDGYSAFYVQAIPFACNDASAIQQLLESRGHFETRLLLEHNADEPRVIEGLDWLFSDGDEDTVLVLYYAGHASREAGDLVFLLPGPDRIRYFAASTLRKQMLHSTAGTVVVVLDCCYAGTFSTFEDGIRSMRLSGRNREVLAACRANERAGERRILGHGLFTHFLLQGMDFGRTTFGSLKDFVMEQMCNLGLQRPVAHGWSESAIHLVEERRETLHEFDVQRFLVETRNRLEKGAGAEPDFVSFPFLLSTGEGRPRQSDDPTVLCDLIRQKKRLLVTGGAGMGKSTLLQHLALLTCWSNYSRPLVPVYLPLGNLRPRWSTFGHTLGSRMGVGHVPVTPRCRHPACDFVFLLDSLHEMPREGWDLIWSELMEWCTTSPHPIVLAARPEDLPDLQGWPRLPRVEIHPLTDEAIGKYVQTRTGDGLLSQSFFGELDKLTTFMSLARRPLLLAHLVHLKMELGALPKSHSAMMAGIVDRYTAGTGPDRDRFRPLLKQLVLEDLALDTLVDDRGLCMEIRRVYSQVGKTLMHASRELPVNPRDITKYQRELVDELLVSGALVAADDEGEAISFAHQVLRDWFAATGLERCGWPEGMDLRLRSWQDVVLVSAEVIKNPERLVERLLQQKHDLLAARCVLAAPAIAEEAVDSVAKALVLTATLLPDVASTLVELEESGRLQGGLPGLLERWLDTFPEDARSQMPRSLDELNARLTSDDFRWPFAGRFCSTSDIKDSSQPAEIPAYSRKRIVLCFLGSIYRCAAAPVLDYHLYEKAVECLEQAIELADTPALKASILNDIGTIRYNTNDHLGAQLLYHEALSLVPDSPNILNSLCQVLHARGESEKAMKCARRAADLDGQNAAIWANLGLLCEEKSNLDDAASAYENAIDLTFRGRHANAQHNLGNVRQKQGRLLDAIDCYERAIDASPLFIGARFARAGALLALGHFERAFGAFNEAIRVGFAMPSGPLDCSTGLNSPDAYYWNLALVVERAGWSLEQVHDMTRLYPPGLTQASVYLADLYLALGAHRLVDHRYSPAVEAFQIALDRGAGAPAHLGLALVGLMLGNRAETERHLEQAKLSPHYSIRRLAIQHQAFFLHLSIGNPRQAIEILEEHIRADPIDGDSYEILCLAQLANDMPEAALRHALIAFSLRGLGERFRRPGEYRWMLEDYIRRPWKEQFYSEARWLARTNLSVGAFNIKGNLCEAELFALMSEREPENPSHLRGRGVALREAGRFDEAAVVLTQYIENVEDPSSKSGGHLDLASVLEKSGDLSAAEEECRKALSLTKYVRPAEAHMANILLEQGRAEEAVDACQRALDQPHIVGPTDEEIMETSRRARGKSRQYLDEWTRSARALELEAENRWLQLRCEPARNEFLVRFREHLMALPDRHPAALTFRDSISRLLN